MLLRDCRITDRILFNPCSGYYGWWIDHFETTPPIPTYSVAALIGVLRKSSDVEDSKVTVYTSKDYLMQTEYVVGETPDLFRTMENYTEIPIQVKKIDFLSVPDFDGESAENWGLNTYRYAPRNGCSVFNL